MHNASIAGIMQDILNNILILNVFLAEADESIPRTSTRSPEGSRAIRVGEEVALLAPHRSRRAELPQRVPQANLAVLAQACMIRGRRSGWRRRSCL